MCCAGRGRARARAGAPAGPAAARVGRACHRGPTRRRPSAHEQGGTCGTSGARTRRRLGA
eukprot:3681256-Prymnesium_polylepis.1